MLTLWLSRAQYTNGFRLLSDNSANSPYLLSFSDVKEEDTVYQGDLLFDGSGVKFLLRYILSLKSKN
jgi:lysozyme family protein